MGLEINNIRAECVSTLGFGRAYTSNDPPCVRCTLGDTYLTRRSWEEGVFSPQSPAGPVHLSPPAPRHPHLPLGDGQATKSTGTAQGVDPQQT